MGLVFIHYEIQRLLHCIKFSFGSKEAFDLSPSTKHYNLYAERPGNMAGPLWIPATPTVKLSNMPKNHAVPWVNNWKLCVFRTLVCSYLLPSFKQILVVHIHVYIYIYIFISSIKKNQVPNLYDFTR